MGHGPVAEGLEIGVGELVVRELQLLEAHHVGLAGGEPGLHEIEPGPQAVDVPGRDAHGGAASSGRILSCDVAAEGRGYLRGPRRP